jgi:hypothetical protein
MIRFTRLLVLAVCLAPMVAIAQTPKGNAQGASRFVSSDGIDAGANNRKLRREH